MIKTQNEITIVSINVNGLKKEKKRFSLFEFFHLMEWDVIMLQETHVHNDDEIEKFKADWKGNSLWSKSNESHSGTAILFKNSLNVEILSREIDYSGRLMCIDCLLNGEKVRLINVYLLTGGQVAAKKDLIQSIAPFLNCKGLLIIGGDFNFVDNTELDKLFPGEKLSRDEDSKVRECFDELKSIYGLIDVYRSRYPNGRSYTFFSQIHKSGSRLDRFYVNEPLLNFIASIDHLDVLWSDHEAVKLVCKLGTNPRGPGYWKCNVSVFDDTYFNDDLVALWARLEKGNKGVYDVDWWEQCKNRIKSLIIKHCSRLAKIRRFKTKLFLRQIAQLKDLYPDDDETRQCLYDKYRNEIEDIMNHKLASLKLHDRATSFINFDKPTKHLLSPNLCRKEKKDINCLKYEGSTYNNTEGILNVCKLYYTKLLGKEKLDYTELEEFLSTVPAITPELCDLCEGPLTFNECKTSIAHMQNGKSPGSDGLPVEFYKKYFDLFGNRYVDFVNNIFCNKGLLSPSQRMSYITLLCKDNDNKQDLNSWRPISLLNVDYKIISRAILVRLRKVVNTIVHPNQTCAIPGRSVTQNLHLVRDLLDYCKERNINACLLTLDQAKAFDRVDHNYLFSILKAFGFGPDIITWVQLLYNKVNSCVFVNGFLTEAFEVTRSMRQGCGLSPLLYVLCIEALALKIRSNMLYKGIPLPGGHNILKIILHADDTTLFAIDNDSFKAALRIFATFSRVSGASLNMDKSKLMVIGQDLYNVYNLPNVAKVDSVKICGVIFGSNNCHLNQEALYAKLQKAITFFKTKGLTYYSKVTLLNVVLLSKLLYVGSVIVFDKKFLKMVNKLLFNYLWPSVEWLKREVIFLPKLEGGLGLLDVCSRFKTFRIKHIWSLLQDPSQWCHDFLNFWIGLALRKFHNINQTPHSESPSSFYKLSLNDFKTHIDLNTFVFNDKFVFKKIYLKIISSKRVIPNIVVKYPSLDFTSIWKHLYSYPLALECRQVWWLIIHRVLPVRERLARLGIFSDPKCCFCFKQIESLEHLFLKCTVLRQLRTLAETFADCNNLFHNSDILYELRLDGNFISPYFSVILSEFLYAIWCYRTEVVIKNKEFSSYACLSLFKCRLRNRVKFDFYRMDLNDFGWHWLNKPMPITVLNDDVVFGF